MEEREIEGLLKEIFNEVVGVDVSTISMDSDLREDIGLDSFSIAEILVLVQDRLGIDISPEDLFNIRSFKDAVDLVSRILNNKICRG